MSDGEAYQAAITDQNGLTCGACGHDCYGKFTYLEQQVARLTEAREKRENHIQELLDDIERLTEKQNEMLWEREERRIEYEVLKENNRRLTEERDAMSRQYASATYECDALKSSTDNIINDLRESLTARDAALREVHDTGQAILDAAAEGISYDEAMDYMKETVARARAAPGESGKGTIET